MRAKKIHFRFLGSITHKHKEISMPQIATTHEVQPGETLHRIAQRFGISFAQLLAANKQITNPDKINIGQKINIPGTEPPPTPEPAPDHHETYDGHHPAAGTTSIARAQYSHPP